MQFLKRDVDACERRTSDEYPSRCYIDVIPPLEDKLKPPVDCKLSVSGTNIEDLTFDLVPPERDSNQPRVSYVCK